MRVRELKFCSSLSFPLHLPGPDPVQVFVRTPFFTIFIARNIFKHAFVAEPCKNVESAQALADMTLADVIADMRKRAQEDGVL